MWVCPSARTPASPGLACCLFLIENQKIKGRNLPVVETGLRGRVQVAAFHTTYTGVFLVQPSSKTPQSLQDFSTSPALSFATGPTANLFLFFSCARLISPVWREGLFHQHPRRRGRDGDRGARDEAEQGAQEVVASHAGCICVCISCFFNANERPARIW